MEALVSFVGIPMRLHLISNSSSGGLFNRPLLQYLLSGDYSDASFRSQFARPFECDQAPKFCCDYTFGSLLCGSNFGTFPIKSNLELLSNLLVRGMNFGTLHRKFFSFELPGSTKLILPNKFENSQTLKLSFNRELY